MIEVKFMKYDPGFPIWLTINGMKRELTIGAAKELIHKLEEAIKSAANSTQQPAGKP